MHIRSSRAPALGLPTALESPRLQSWLVFSFIKQKTHVPPRAFQASRDGAFKIHGAFVPTWQTLIRRRPISCQAARRSGSYKNRSAV